MTALGTEPEGVNAMRPWLQQPADVRKAIKCGVLGLSSIIKKTCDIFKQVDINFGTLWIRKNRTENHNQ